MTLSQVNSVETSFGLHLFAVDCPKHGRVAVKNEGQDAIRLAFDHDYDMHPRAFRKEYA